MAPTVPRDEGKSCHCRFFIETVNPCPSFLLVLLDFVFLPQKFLVSFASFWSGFSGSGKCGRIFVSISEGFPVLLLLISRCFPFPFCKTHQRRTGNDMGGCSEPDDKSRVCGGEVVQRALVPPAAGGQWTWAQEKGIRPNTN